MPATRGPNNRVIAERLGRQRAFVESVRDDAEAAALVAGRGYSADRIAEGLARFADALTAYGGRDTASGTRTGAGKALATADADARARLAELRATLIALYDGQPGHLEALGVATERLATDRDVFLTESRATLSTVRTAPYADEVAEAGQKKEALDAADAAIAALATAAGAHGSADGTKENATDARDAAYRAAQTWLTRFRRFVRIAVKDHPAVAARLGL